jgi:MarR family transcriptional regulator, lower aerobic nicotinate degradation pathway regulator
MILLRTGVRLHAVIEKRAGMRREKLFFVTPAGVAPRPGRYVLDDQVGFLLRVTMQRHTAIFTTRMVEGLTQTQFATLAKLHEVGPCSQNHLGRLIYLDAATIKGVVDRLAARGFLTAVSDPSDRRRRAVALTERGRQATEAAMRVAAEITAATLEPLSEDERSAVVKLLRKLG